MSKRNAKTGKRSDIPHFVRSSWEANFSRYLTHRGIPYEYEPKTFYFNTWERRGAMHYTPDFYLPDEDRYVEIKGQMASEDRTKLRRMAKYYPEVRVDLIDGPAYADLEKQYAHFIPNWEFPAKRERDMKREKVEKSLEELTGAGFSTVSLHHPEFDLLGFNDEQIRFIRILYVQDIQDPEVQDAYTMLAETPVPEGCIQKELWVYRYGQRGYVHHII